VKYGLTGVLAVLMYWLGKLGSRLVEAHIASLERRDRSMDTHARALLVIAEELRVRPCMLTAEHLRRVADGQVEGTEEKPV